MHSGSRDLFLTESELDIDELKRAANDMLKDQVFRTATGGDAYEKTHRKFNPIQTPIESEKNPKIYTKLKQSMLGAN